MGNYGQICPAQLFLPIAPHQADTRYGGGHIQVSPGVFGTRVDTAREHLIDCAAVSPGPFPLHSEEELIKTGDLGWLNRWREQDKLNRPQLCEEAPEMTLGHRGALLHVANRPKSRPRCRRPEASRAIQTTFPQLSGFRNGTRREARGARPVPLSSRHLWSQRHR